jgi:fructokinase
MRYDIVAIGELLIDMTAEIKNNELRYIPNPGGAPANFLTMAQTMGATTCFIGKVGNDYFGNILKKCLENKGVCTKGLILDSRYPTTLAFVHLNKGESSFSFYRNKTADVMLGLDEIDLNILERSKAVYFGSLAFSSDPLSNTVNNVVNKAKEMNKILFFDVNYRPSLWESEEKALKEIKLKLNISDVVKLSKQELLLITEEDKFDKAINKLHKFNIPLVFVTRGEDSTVVVYKSEIIYVNTFKTKIVDTTGAGDAFFGVIAKEILANNGDIKDLSKENLHNYTQLANLVAAISVNKYGGIPSYPSLSEIEKQKRENDIE